jgi:hypothetical protein
MSEDTEARPTVYPDPDRFLTMAKRLVADNYNAHQDEEETPPLTIDDLYIVWFSKVLNNWRAQVQSSLVRGLLWMVTYNGPKNEAYIEVYRKINNTKVQTRGRSPS